MRIMEKNESLYEEAADHFRRLEQGEEREVRALGKLQRA